MIVDGQKNLKVHFASGENIAHSYSLSKGGGVRYMLWTVFPFIASCLNIKAMSFNEEVPVYQEFKRLDFRHTIMDSGIYTLCWGAHSGRRTEKEIETWYQALVQFVLENKIQSIIVEVDCQAILGVEDAWKFRERMREDLPDNRIINVWHLEDGHRGLDRLIEFTDFIALGLPELRTTGLKKAPYVLSDYIKNRKPEIDIHLLGCTGEEMLQDLQWCTSTDSTSWLTLLRYGAIMNWKTRQVFSRKDILLEKIRDEYGWVADRFKIRYHKELTEGMRDVYCLDAFCAEFWKQEYTRVCGDQN